MNKPKRRNKKWKKRSGKLGNKNIGCNISSLIHFFIF
jgi:hypothetical protein